jgi:tRNA1(Val) A37 N6-methylase TrmN6
VIELQDDAFLDGQLVLAQPVNGYRAGMDAMLLAASIEGAPGQHLMEAGCGAGHAVLAAAHRLPACRFTGLEREPLLVAAAKANVARNCMISRVDIQEADCLQDGLVYDGVFCNPPFDDLARAQRPGAGRVHAYVTETPLDGWIKALANRLRGGAALTLIHRAHRLGELLAAFEGRLGGVEIFPVRPRADQPAKRVLIRARKGSRQPLRLYAGLDLHEAGPSRHSARAEALWRGAALEWR